MKELQRAFTYTSKSRKDTVDGLLADKASLDERSGAFIYEDCVIGSFVVNEKQSRAWLNDLYATDDNGNRIKNVGTVLSGIYDVLSAGINLEAKSANGRPLVEYGYWLHNTNRFELESHKSEDIKYASNKIQCLLDRFRIKADGECQEYINMLQGTKNEFDEGLIYSDSISALYIVILSNWDLFGNYMNTYKLLFAIPRLMGYYDNAETRMRLVEAINTYGESEIKTK